MGINNDKENNETVSTAEYEFKLSYISIVSSYLLGNALS